MTEVQVPVTVALVNLHPQADCVGLRLLLAKLVDLGPCDAGGLELRVQVIPDLTGVGILLSTDRVKHVGSGVMTEGHTHGNCRAAQMVRYPVEGLVDPVGSLSDDTVTEPDVAD